MNFSTQVAPEHRRARGTPTALYVVAPYQAIADRRNVTTRTGISDPLSLDRSYNVTETELVSMVAGITPTL